MTGVVVEQRLQPKTEGSNGPYRALNAAAIAAMGLPAGEVRISHGAFVYRWKKEVRVFELRGHEDLNDGIAPAGFVWVEPGIPPERLRLVANRARLVYRLHGEKKVPYGFRYRTSSFDEKGSLSLGDGEVGLTCATIVAALFESEKLPLLDPSQWPAPDEEDKRTRLRFLERLEAGNVDRANLLRRELNAPRISPEEVVAASAIYPQMGTFENLQDGAGVVRQRIGT